LLHLCCRSFRATDAAEEAKDVVASDGYDPKVGGVVPKDQLGMLDGQYTGATKQQSLSDNPHLRKFLDEKLKGSSGTTRVQF